MRNPDLLWQIRAGDQIRATSARLHIDTFSSTLQGKPIHDHESAWEVVVSFLHQFGGVDCVWWVNLGVVWLVLVASTFWSDPLNKHRPVATPARLIGLAICVAIVAARLELRAEAVTFCAVAFAMLLRRGVHRDSFGPPASGFANTVSWLRIVSPAILAVVAAPFHGLAIILVAVPGAFVLEGCWQFRKGFGNQPRLNSPEASYVNFAVIAADLAVLIAIPFAAELAAPGLSENLRNHLHAPTFASHIVEGYSPIRLWKAGDPFQLFACALAVLAACGLAFQRRGRFADRIFLLGLVLPGLVWSRFSSVAVLCGLPLMIVGLGGLFTTLLEKLRMSLQVGLAGVVVATSAFVVTADFGSSAIIGFDWSRQPIAAVRVLKANYPNARIFNAYNYGAYLIYSGYPPAGVSIDSRAAIAYDDTYAARYYRALSDPETFDTWVREASFDLVLLPSHHKSTAPLALRLSAHKDWQVVYADAIAIAIVRRTR